MNWTVLREKQLRGEEDLYGLCSDCFSVGEGAPGPSLAVRILGTSPPDTGCDLMCRAEFLSFFTSCWLFLADRALCFFPGSCGAGGARKH